MEVQPVYTEPPSAHSQCQIVREGYNMLTDVLREPLHELHCEADITPRYFVIFDVFPFAAGAQRLAFKGSIFERRPSSDAVFHVHVVVKMEMANNDLVARCLDERTRICAEEAEKTVRKHEIASKLAANWGDLGINKSVYFLSTEKIRITRGCSLDKINQIRYPMLHHLFKKLSLDSVLYKNAVGTVEDYLPGKFTKFLNNDGNANSKVTANFPAAFVHWSWVQSGGEYMVSDIQGVRTGSGYVLTDPCIHSVREQDGYGMSDLRMDGIEEFFDKHKCNDLCSDLGLGKDSKDLDLGHTLRTRLAPTDSPADLEENCSSLNRKQLQREKRDEKAHNESRVEIEKHDGKVQRRETMRIKGKWKRSDRLNILSPSLESACEEKENETIESRDKKGTIEKIGVQRRMNLFGLQGIFRGRKKRPC